MPPVAWSEVRPAERRAVGLLGNERARRFKIRADADVVLDRVDGTGEQQRDRPRVDRSRSNASRQRGVPSSTRIAAGTAR